MLFGAKMKVANDPRNGSQHREHRRVMGVIPGAMRCRRSAPVRWCPLSLRKLPGEGNASHKRYPEFICLDIESVIPSSGVI